MKKFVSESLQEFNEAAAGKSGKAKKVKQNPNQKADDAIAGLKAQLADAKKPGNIPTKIQKDAKIKELTDKIAKWEAKKK